MSETQQTKLGEGQVLAEKTVKTVNQTYALKYSENRRDNVKIEIVKIDDTGQVTHRTKCFVKQKNGLWALYVWPNYRGSRVKKLDALRTLVKLTHYNSNTLQQQLEGSMNILQN